MAALFARRARLTTWLAPAAPAPLASLAARLPLAARSPPGGLLSRGAVCAGKVRWATLGGACARAATPARAGLAAALESCAAASAARAPAGLGLARAVVVRRSDVAPTAGAGARTFATKSCQTFRKRFKLKPNGRLKHKLAGNNHKTSTKNRKRKNRIKFGGFTTDNAAKSIRRWLGKSTKA